MKSKINKITTGVESNILGEMVNLKELFKERPDLFNTKKLLNSNKVELLCCDFAFYKDKIDVSQFSPSDKLQAILSIDHKEVEKYLELSEKDLNALTVSEYNNLLSTKFRKYFRKELFKKLSKSSQNEYFEHWPEFIFNETGELPRMTVKCLANLSASFVDKHITDFSNLSTNYKFWYKMISFDEKYKEIFIHNTKTLDNKTSVRVIIRKFPDIIKLITPDIFENSKLTVKEWILLINQVTTYDHNKDIFKNWKFSDDVAYIMELDLTAEMLNGQSKFSKKFSNAKNRVFNKDTNENNEQTTTEDSNEDSLEDQ